MPHIHTAPNQHDMTVSAYIILRDGEDLKCLVHLHKKVGKLMQIGGHIELDETPWQSVVHELFEESGYDYRDNSWDHTETCREKHEAKAGAAV